MRKIILNKSMRYNLDSFRQLKQQGEKFTCLTAYDGSFAQLMELCGVECLLVGDSLGMVIKGSDSTLSVTLEEMIYHVNCVSRSTQQCFIMSDLPFGCCASIEDCYRHASVLMAAGAHMVKIEGGQYFRRHIEFLSCHGIPVCSHLGLLPQSVHKTSGYKVQGKSARDAEQIISDATLMEDNGADMILLECVPAELAAEVSAQVGVPVIGIGAGKHCDAQVLVSYDMLGITPGGGPSFSRNFLAQSGSIENAFKSYVAAVKTGTFPE